MPFQTHYCCQNSSCCSIFDFVLISTGFFANYRSKLLFSVLVLSLILSHFKGKMLHLLPLHTSCSRSIAVIYTPSHMGMFCSFHHTPKAFPVVLTCFSSDKETRSFLYPVLLGCFLFSFLKNICLFSQIFMVF